MKVRVIKCDEDNWYKVGEVHEVREELQHRDGQCYYPVMESYMYGLDPEHCEVVIDEEISDTSESAEQLTEDMTQKFKIGDKVKVVRKATQAPKGKRHFGWSDRMDKTIGDECVITGDTYEVYGTFELDNGWFYLQESLELVEDVAENRAEEIVKIDAHYNFNYTLTEAEKTSGVLKVDPYFVARMWRIGSKDDSGVLFHCLKNISRFGDKNSREREIVGLFKQVKRLAQLEGVTLE